MKTTSAPGSKKSATRLRVVLVGRNWLFRSLVEERLSNIDGVLLASSAPTGKEAAHAIKSKRPDVLLVAAEDLEDGTVKDLSGWVLRYSTRVYAVACHDITKAAALTRRPPIEGIITPWMSDELINLILRSHNGSTGKVNGLSQREKMVVEHLQSGMTMKAVAIELGCSIPAVQSYKQRAMLKLGASNSNELAVRWRSAIGTSVR